MSDTRDIVVRLDEQGEWYSGGHGPAHKEAAGVIRELRAEIKRLRALLVRYQAANYIPEDCDLYAETKRALEGVKG